MSRDLCRNSRVYTSTVTLKHDPLESTARAEVVRKLPG
jgi:hypothetical protein